MSTVNVGGSIVLLSVIAIGPMEPEPPVTRMTAALPADVNCAPPEDDAPVPTIKVPFTETEGVPADATELTAVPEISAELPGTIDTTELDLGELYPGGGGRTNSEVEAGGALWTSLEDDAFRLGTALEPVPTKLPLVGEGGITPEPPVLKPIEKPPLMLKSFPPDTTTPG